MIKALDNENQQYKKSKKIYFMNNIIFGMSPLNSMKNRNLRTCSSTKGRCETFM